MKLHFGIKAAWLKQPEEKQSSSEQDEENEQEEEQEEEQEALQSIRGKKSRRAVQTTKKSYYTKQTDGTGTGSVVSLFNTQFEHSPSGNCMLTYLHKQNISFRSDLSP